MMHNEEAAGTCCPKVCRYSKNGN